jgi:hypothetical protein
VRYYRLGENGALVLLDKIIRGQGKAISLLKMRQITSDRPSKNELNLIFIP